MDPRKNIKPEQQLNKMGTIGEDLKKLISEQNAARIKSAEMSMKVAELQKARIEEQAALARAQYEMEMKKIAEERGALEEQKVIADAQLEINKNLALGLAALTGNKDFYDSIVKSFGEINEKRKEGEERAKAIEENILKSVGIQNKSYSDLGQKIQESTIRLSEYDKVIAEGADNIEALNKGLIKARDVDENKLSKARVESGAGERIKEEQRLANVLSKINIEDKKTAEAGMGKEKTFDEMLKQMTDMNSFVKGILSNNGGAQNQKLIDQISNFSAAVDKASTQTMTDINTKFSGLMDMMRAFQGKPFEMSINITDAGGKPSNDMNVDVSFGGIMRKMTIDKMEKLSATYGEVGLLPGG
jgi:hypothetical protein